MKVSRALVYPDDHVLEHLVFTINKHAPAVLGSCDAERIRRTCKILKTVNNNE
jgi:hypothetical protein